MLRKVVRRPAIVPNSPSSGEIVATGTPEDVANVVLFLVSPLASYITGVVVDINGGMYMG